MKIIVQALGIHTGGGPYNHLQGFLKALAEGDSPHDWTFVLNETFNVEPNLPPSVRVKKVTIENPGQRLYQDFVRQRIGVERSGADVLLNLIDFGPLPHGVPTLSFQRNPNYYDTRLLQLRHGINRVEWELRRRMAHRVVRHSQRVLCPSETMADAVRKSVRVPSDRVGSLFHPYERPSSEATWTLGSARRILYTGHLMPHKNHRWLLEAFVESGLGGEGFELWMTAERQDWPAGYDAMVKLAQQAGVEGQLHLLGRVSPEDMNDLYRSATAFAFVSAGESFGHPMVEALSLGLPILALDTAIAREILGSAADYLPEAVSVAGPIMRDALTRGDDDLRRRSQVSLERAQVACVSWHSWLASLENELEAVASG